ncbi:hypothetical protein ASF73_13785 [Xanthomonas sp. Leaf131]|nr:hypothetical protein ASF73_13785 [Xanthomonas sp. Leaf131]
MFLIDAALWVNRTLIRPAGTFSRWEKGVLLIGAVLWVGRTLIRPAGPFSRWEKGALQRA